MESAYYSNTELFIKCVHKLLYSVIVTSESMSA